MRHTTLILAAALALAACAAPLLAGDAPKRSGVDGEPEPAVPEAPLHCADLDGVEHRLAPNPGFRGAAVVFLETGCPIARKAIPELNALAGELASAGIPVYGAITDRDTTREAARAFAREFSVAFPILFDASGSLAARLRPSRTPEAFVIDRAGALAYQGRIDDRWVTTSKYRPLATSRDLRDAMLAVALGKAPRVARTEAVGCVFEAGALEAVPEAPTYAREIAPILNAACVECHRADGIAPFSLASHADARKKAGTIAEVTAARQMPPWHAEAGFGRFADERRLSGREIALLDAWAKAGAPAGDEKDLPPARAFPSGWTLGEPDIVVEMPEPYTVPAGGRDIYRAFVIPLGVSQDAFVRAVEFRPGAKTVLHHALFFLDSTGKGRELDAGEPGPGYTSFGGPRFLPSGALGGWAPGAQPRPYPDGVGRMLRKGSDLVMQVHYHPGGKEEKDRSKLAIYLAKKPVAHPIVGIWLATRDIDIPAGDASYERRAKFILPVNVTAYGITPHMHLIGREMRVTATLPDGEVIPLISVKDWDFQWQDQYKFVEPIPLPKGTRIDLFARYDNSADNPRNPSSPPRRVTFGEETTDEMCFCPIEVTTEQFQDVLLLLREAQRQLGRISRREQ